MLRVRCDCGKEFDIRRSCVTRSRIEGARDYIKSCGCLNAELISLGQLGINAPKNHEKRRENGRRNMEAFHRSPKGQTYLKNLAAIGTKRLQQYHRDHPEARLLGQLAMPKMDTRLELAVKAKLDALGLRYEHPFNLHNHFLVDFCLTDSNTIIEADGCYWHGCKPCGYDNGKDKRTNSRNAYIRAHGYNLVVVPEHETPDFPSLTYQLTNL